MTGTDEEFRKRLLATFREEADEHLGEITEGLIALEKTGVGAGSALIEQIYRKTHSLKGAARAVSQRETEAVCQNLETVFSALKKGEFVPTAEDYDLFHEAVKVIRSLLSGSRTTGRSPAEIGRALRALSAPDRNTFLAPGLGSAGKRDELTGRDYPGPAPAEPVTYSAPDRHAAGQSPGVCHTGEPSPGDPGGTGNSAKSGETPPVKAWESGTVRIAAGKLDRLITGSDNLLTTRLFITHRMQELEEMTARFALWQWNYSLVSSDVHRIRESSSGPRKSALPEDLVLPLQRIVEFLEYDREFIHALRHDLGAHIRDTAIDRSALEASTSAISELIHEAVLLPISSIFVPFSGIVREFSRETGKSVDLEITGGDIEMDRRILESLKDPLMHLIHNSIDHGIEYPDIRAAGNKPPRGSVKIRIDPLSGSKVGIEVTDDGAGIDPAIIRRTAVEKGVAGVQEVAGLSDKDVIWLIFRSGLSTSPALTNLSGRGLGLAIVEESVTRLGGTLSLSSTVGKGTAVRMVVPVRLATVRGIVIRAGTQVYVVPMQQVRQVTRVGRDDIIIEGGLNVIRFQDETIRVIRLTEALGIPDFHIPRENGKPSPAVIIAYGAGQIACIVDEVIRVQEIVVRSLGSQLRRVKRITGAVLLGDGRVALVLDPLELIQEALKGGVPPSIRSQDCTGVRKILVVEDSVTSRSLLQTLLERAGYHVTTAIDGAEAFAILKEHEIDMVVSDVDMPRMNGFTLTGKIRGDPRLAALPVVLVTSLDSPEDRKHGLAVGADAYLVKSSFERGNLLDVIRGLMGGRR